MRFGVGYLLCMLVYEVETMYILSWDLEMLFVWWYIFCCYVYETW